VRSSTGNLVAICVAFAVTAFLGGMAASIVFGGDDDGGNNSVVAQPTAINRTPGAGVPATGSPSGVLPTVPALQPTAAPPQPTATPAAASTYTVVAGDTLTGIAIKQNIPVDRRIDWIQQVRTLNSLTGDNINIGQTLRLPPAGAAPAATTPAAGATSAPAGPTATRPATTPAAAPATTATRTP
jgi:LysM repeat protein